MNRKRLIDADVLIDKLHTKICKIDNGRSYRKESLSVADGMRIMELEYSIGLTQCEPVIDAVEVVRCRECVHATVFRTGSVSCGYHDWCRINVDPDGYCNHGEKDIDDLADDGGAEA